MNEQSTTNNESNEKSWSMIYEETRKLNWEPIRDEQPEDVDQDHPINQWFREAFDRRRKLQEKQEESIKEVTVDTTEVTKQTERYYQHGDNQRSGDYDE